MSGFFPWGHAAPPPLEILQNFGDEGAGEVASTLLSRMAVPVLHSLHARWEEKKAAKAAEGA